MSKVLNFKGDEVAIPTEPSASFAKSSTDEAARLVSEVFNQQTGLRHYQNEVRFCFYNHPVLMEALQSGRAQDLPSLPKCTNKAAIIIGSGPTLDEALPLLKDWRHDIICSTSHGPTLIRWGVVPDHIVALDPDSYVEEMAVPGGREFWAQSKTTVHMHPGIDPEFAKWWPGKIALFRKLQPQTPFYANEQNMGYSTMGVKTDAFGIKRYDSSASEPLIKGQVPMLGCVTAAQICIAKHLGYRQLFLVGCDNSFPGDQYRFTASRWDNDAEWIDVPVESLEVLNVESTAHSDPIVETEYPGLKSSPLFIFYLHQVVIAWRITETNIVNTSHKGLLRMFPYMPLEEVIRRQDKGVKAFNLKQIREVAEEHLAKQNIYFLWIGNGVMPHEFKDPLHEIPRMIEQLKATLAAKGRGKEFDAEANRKRIEKLFKKVMKHAP